ncbi:MAG: DUF1254 domain-containing protein [Aquisalinus sp.]|nr:DUF1254 domain-containing protein [Aquisalinus sp.]
MIRVVFWLAGVALVAFGTVQIAAHKMPTIIMAGAMKKLEEGYGADVNEFGHSGPITADNQRVVRPSPDLAYSICLYDLTDGAVAVTVPKAANYLSVALYDMGTNNFFHLNDDEMESDLTRVIILPAGENAGSVTQLSSQAEKVAISPTNEGLVLVRRVLMDEQDWPMIEEERKLMTCEAVKPN